MVGFMKSALNLLGLNKEGSASSAPGLSLEEFLAELAGHMGFQIRFVQKDGDAGTLNFEVEGDDVEEFLGESSEMLEALAHISMRFQRRIAGAANEASPENSSDFRVSFNSGNFRETKTQALRDLAGSKRQKVLDGGGKPAYINALGPAERKVIHTYLTDLGDVVSESIGSGYFKRIRVRMKDDTRVHSDTEGRSEQQPRRSNGNGQGGGGNGGGGRGGRGGQQRRGGGGGGQGQGGGRFNNNNGGGGRGPRPQQQNNFARPANANPGEPNGNRVRPESAQPDIDDNIGNRLRPGEEPLFGVFGSNNKVDDNN